LRDKAPHLLGGVFEDLGKRSGADKVTTVKDPVTGQTRIAVPAKLTHRLISWYRNVLVHPGTECLYNTLANTTLDQECWYRSRSMLNIVMPVRRLSEECEEWVRCPSRMRKWNHRETLQ